RRDRAAAAAAATDLLRGAGRTGPPGGAGPGAPDRGAPGQADLPGVADRGQPGTGGADHGVTGRVGPARPGRADRGPVLPLSGGPDRQAGVGGPGAGQRATGATGGAAR